MRLLWKSGKKINDTAENERKDVFGMYLGAEATKTFCFIRCGQLEIIMERNMNLLSNPDMSFGSATFQLCDHARITSSVWAFNLIL